MIELAGQAVAVAFVSGNDPVGCDDSCVEDLGSQDFISDSSWRNMIWGVDPPLPAT